MAEEAEETEKLLREGEMIEKKAMETMNRAIPMVVDYLNTLSVEEQQDLIKTNQRGNDQSRAT